MNPPDPIRGRPRDIIDELEDLCERGGSVAEIGPDYYESFLALTDDEMAFLARAVLSGQAKEAGRILATESVAKAPDKLIRLAGNVLSVLAIGLARLNHFGQLRFFKRVGPEPEPDVHEALMEKIANARPIIERAVREFVRQHDAAKPDASQSPEQNAPAPPSGRGWQTKRNPETESARIWQLQLTLFPQTPREVCERIGINWLAACQIHAGGWLSFDPRSVTSLNEAQEAELHLIGPLVVAGCDPELIARLLHGLSRPYQYRPGTIYLDWAAACWRLLPIAKKPEPYQVFAEWLDDLKESGDRQQLEDIAADIATALKSLPTEGPEPD